MPSKFQKAVDCTLQGIPGIICYLDGILVVSKGTLTEHNEVVQKVLSRFGEEGFALKLPKCEFAVNKLEWLGFDIHSKGYSPNFSKNDVIKSFASTKTLGELHSFMGTLNHKTCAKTLCQVFSFLRANSESLQTSAIIGNLSGKLLKNLHYRESGASLQKSLTCHYDPAKNTRVNFDASHSGFGVCLEQETDTSLWVLFRSLLDRFLKSAELN